MENTRRLLTRNTRDGKVAGVAAGIGDYLGVDPVLVRLGFVLLTFAGGAGLIAYAVGWALIPEGDAPPEPARPAQRDSRWLLGAALVVLGAVGLAGIVRPWWFHDAHVLWPVLLIAAGAALLLWRRDDRGPGAPVDGPPGPGGQGAEDQPTAADADEQPTAEHTPGSVEEQPTAEQPVVRALAATGTWPEAAAAAVPRLPSAGRRRRLPVGLIALGVIVISGAVAALLDVTGALDVSVTWFLVYAFGLAGIALVASAWFGRARGPVALSLVLGVALAAALLVDVPLRGGVGDRTVQPRAADQLAAEYRLGVGRLVLDLRQLSFFGEPRRVEAGVGVGELIVLLPPGVDAHVEGSASVGEVQLFDVEEGGVHVDRTYTGDPWVASTSGLTLDLEVGVGRVETRTEQAPPAGGSF